MSARFERIAVLGLGLLGGSVALAARRRGVARSIAALVRRPEAAREAVAQGLADEAGIDPEAAVAGASLVVVATPLAQSLETVRRAAPGLAAGCVVTDVGSVKGPLAEQVPGLLPRGVSFVGAHPMAGSHRRGPQHARAELFEGAVCVLTPGPLTPGEALAQVREFWEALGSRVQLRDPARHDEEVGWVSHVPHALAYAFAHTLAGAPGGLGEVAGRGFRDFTRIARSDPELWAEILAANRKAVAGPLREAAAAAEELARRIESGDADAVERFLAEARESLARSAEPDTAGSASPAHPFDRSDEHDS